ncbi:alpha/beta-hydrolase [Aspergillus foveolatus]|uniref:alpha/beta-hydrolase n=1 Tax=Aspergillus foveolatus TaxID=210207 RepID=UPI003CCCD41E
MALSPLIVTEHVVDCQHIREYPRATKEGNDVLKLAIKRYTPRSNPNPQPGDVTVIGAHGSGFPKELYEPIWEEILSRLSTQGIRIRSIWIADTANQSASGILNEENLGNDPSWFDHARDLLHMVNIFSADMPRPIVGIGHSLGAGQLVLLSLLHPRLFTSLVLMEPVLEKNIHAAKGPIFVKLSLDREDIWRSRSEAAKYFKRLFHKWDPRVLERWLEHGLRDVRPVIDLTKAEGSVTLTTSKHQEVVQYLRPNFQKKRPLKLDKDLGAQELHDPVFYPDIIGPPHAIYPFYRFEPILAWRFLKHVRPSVLYLFGENSPVSTPELRAEKLERTGKGIGGSGGYKNNRVKEVIFPGAGHHLPFEAVEGVSDAASGWLRQEMVRWKEAEVKIDMGWLELPREARTSISHDWHIYLETYLDRRKSQQGSKL